MYKGVMQDGPGICIQGSCRMGLGCVYRGQAGWAWDMYKEVMQDGQVMQEGPRIYIQGSGRMGRSCRIGLGYVYRGHAGWAWDMYTGVRQDGKVVQDRPRISFCQQLRISS